MATSHHNLYRKYRPQSFADVIGQEETIRALKYEITNKTPAHSYLFSGTRGVGKTTIARILAKELGVSERDLHEIDAASHTGVDDIREIRDAVHVLPFNSPYKVYLLDEAHMLSKSAFNALLKTLEEPPAHVIFMLATTEPEKLPETILSRCEHHALRPPHVEQLRSFLSDIAKKESLTLSPSAAGLIATAARGSFRDALSLLQRVRASLPEGTTDITSETLTDILGTPSLSLIHSILTALMEKNTSAVLQNIEKAAHEGYDFATIPPLLLERLRAVLLLQRKEETLAHLSSYTDEEQKLLRSLAQGKEVTLSLLKKLLLLNEELAHSSAPRLTLEIALLSVVESPHD